MKQISQFPVFTTTNPNKDWVYDELDKLIAEWQRWNDVCQRLGDSPDYEKGTCTEAIKDGRDNLRKHEILREKTLVFLRNQFTGAEFVLEKWPKHPHENNTVRLREVVTMWIQRLDVLKASMNYVRVPDGYWKSRGKELVEAITRSAPDKAAEIAAALLKNPYGSMQ